MLTFDQSSAKTTMNHAQAMSGAALPRELTGLTAVGRGVGGFPPLAGVARSSWEDMALAGDLRLLVGECALIRFVRDAVAVVVQALPPGPQRLNTRLDSRMLLALITYGYAAGDYASEDIEWNCQWDPATRQITAAAPVGQDELRAFRRASRPWIEGCLARVLEQVAAARQIGVRECRDGYEVTEEWPNSVFWDLAHRRVELAILMDMAMAD
jgi:hypothetical protein